MSKLLDFYRGRIESAPKYGFRSGHEILRTVTRTAFWDSQLTEDEFTTIINLCEEAHKYMMEENFNAGWKDE